jgi:hypothetical protein
MSVTEVEIRERNPYCYGERFGDGPAYERIDGIVNFAVDPADAANARIVDLANATRDRDGLVRFGLVLGALQSNVGLPWKEARKWQVAWSIPGYRRRKKVDLAWGSIVNVRW